MENRKKELANGPKIRERAFGEALDPDKLDRFDRYEINLVRKFDRYLIMLFRLKDLRRGAIAGDPVGKMVAAGSRPISDLSTAWSVPDADRFCNCGQNGHNEFWF